MMLPDRAADHYSYALSTRAMLIHRFRSGSFLGQGEMLSAAAASGYLRDAAGEVNAVRFSLSLIGFWLFAAVLAVALPDPRWVALGAGLAILGLALKVAWKHRSLVSGLNSLFIWHVSAAGLLLGLVSPRRPPNDPIRSVVLHDRTGAAREAASA